tara:strand:+ start:542 stop:994 length:453 start_codon:yes stop_codon:yes gene_type:complete
MNTRYATFKMDRGNIIFRLYEEAPIQLNRFIHNVKNNLFKGVKFYRVVPGFCIQTSPLEGEGIIHSRMYDEVIEPRRLKNNNFHAYGVLSGCSTGTEHTSMGAFFIALSRHTSSHLDSTQTTFGHVIKGMELIEQIEQDETINNIIISES